MSANPQAMRTWYYRLINGREDPNIQRLAHGWLAEWLENAPLESDPPTPDDLLAEGPDDAAPTLAMPDAQRLIAHAPIGLIEGAWLQSVAVAANGHRPDVAELFAAYLALLGKDETASPVFAYRAALVGQGVSLPPVDSWRLAQDRRISADAFGFGAVLLALGLRGSRWVSEAIGFTLAYAQSRSPWRMPCLSAESRRERLRIVHGCAGAALRAHLDVEPSEGASRWLRVRRGHGLYRRLASAHDATLEGLTPPSLVQRVADILRSKAVVAFGYHGQARLGERTLDEWFGAQGFDAEGFMAAFRDSDHARDLARLTDFGGPMFGVFDTQELQFIDAWLAESVSVAPANVPNIPTACSAPIPAPPAAVPVPPGRPGRRVWRDVRGLFHRLLEERIDAQTEAAAFDTVAGHLVRADRCVRRKGSLRERFFDYSPDGFAQRIAAVHAAEVARVQPFSPPPRLRRDEYVHAIAQFAPAVLVDGCWLQYAGDAARQHEPLHRLLYRIYADELGGGRVERNHPNVYRSLLDSVHIDLPPIESEAFARSSVFLDAAFDLPTYLLAIARFPKTFLPELIGLNLAIELSGLGAGYRRLADELDYWGIDPQIVNLHQSIDNLATGHAALAVEAIQRYLDDVRSLQGDAAMQAQWRRVWCGYLSLGAATRRFKRALLVDAVRRFGPGRLGAVVAGFLQALTRRPGSR